MDELFDVAAWREILVRALSELSTDVAGFLPNLVGAALILVVGWLLSRALQAVAGRALRALGLDGIATRVGIANLLERAAIRMTLSAVVARLLFWLVMLTFLLSSVETLGLSAVTTTIDRLIAFIPGVLGAVVLGIAGLVLARFVGTLVSSAAAAAGYLSAPRLGFVSQVLVGGLVLVVALEQIGVAIQVLVLPFSVAVGAAGLAVGLAFALGARDVIAHILAGHFLKQSLPRDTAVEIEGRRGLVRRVGAVDTLLEGEGEVWSVPNARLLDHTVVR
jgi:hypothetical protein